MARAGEDGLADLPRPALNLHQGSMPFDLIMRTVERSARNLSRALAASGAEAFVALLTVFPFSDGLKTHTHFNLGTDVPPGRGSMQSFRGKNQAIQ
jgi:hypothetical protein